MFLRKSLATSPFSFPATPFFFLFASFFLFSCQGDSFHGTRSSKKSQKKVNIRRASHQSKSPASQLNSKNLYAKIQVVEIKKIFSDVARTSFIGRCRLSYPHYLPRNIITVETNKAHWPLDQRWIRERKTLWLSLSASANHFRLDHLDSQRLQNRPDLITWLEANSPTKAPSPPSRKTWEKHFQRLVKGKKEGQIFFRRHLPHLEDYFLKKISSLKSIPILQRCLLVLSAHSSRKVVRFLSHYHSHPLRSLRITSATALGEMAHPRSLKGLLLFIDDSHFSLRKWVAYYLKFLPPRLVKKGLLRLVKDSTPAVHRQALRSLGVLRIEEPFSQIKGKWKNSSQRERREIILYLGRLGIRPALAELKEIASSPQTPSSQALLALKALRYHQGRSVPYLIALIGHSDNYLSWRALYELRAVTGHSFSYSSPLSSKDKREAQRSWKLWWEGKRERIDRASQKR